MVQASKDELATFFEVSLDLLVIRDLEGRIVRVNDAWETVLGHPREALEGALMTDFVHPEDLEATRRRQARVGEEVVDGFVNRYRHRDGHYRSFEWRARQMGARVFGLARDVTDRLAAAEELREAKAAAEAANRAKSDFLANMSHEIRTPLNGVIGLVSALSRTSLDANQREMVELAGRSGETLQRLVSDILDMAKIEAGRLELESRLFDLEAELDSVLDLHRRAAEEKGLRFVASVQAQGRYVGDPVRIKQVLGNLLSNAVKFTEAGKVTVSLNVSPPADGAVFLVIGVEDTGVGFPPEVAAGLFRRFSQIDSSVARRFGGTGLGLAICRDLVETMGGRIDARSSPGRGSLFEAVLPLRPAAASAPDPDPAPAGPEAPTLGQVADGQLQVLLVEDHPVNRRVVELLLEPLGARITAVGDGAEALAAFRSRRFDLVLMDMQMPVMDGLTATRAIRALERETGARRVPLAMLSASAMAEQVQQALEAGADVHIAKPVTAETLLAGVRVALEQAL